MYWDLRYVPLVISSIYWGPLAGIVNYMMILLMRTYLGGDALLFGYISMTLSFIIPFVASFKIKGFTGSSRIKAAILVSLSPLMVMLLILMSYVSLYKGFETFDLAIIPAMLSFGILLVLGTWLSSLLQEIHEERFRMKVQIQKAEKMKTLGELAASIAHEVRNPLTVVQGFLQLMRPNEQGKNQQYLNIAMEELARAESIINDYLNFSKPKLTKLESFSFSDVLNNIIVLLTPMAMKNCVEITVSLEDHIYIFSDRGQLQQALVNVIKNAIEATPAGGEVKVSLKRLVGRAEIKVIDNGKGMTKEQLSRIGNLFYSTKDVGTGLGTAVSIRIIETMNGEMNYESEEGVGTTVTITLPL
ncbi:ATP-binding protein [Paenibacillus alginolyticus]|uniref:ATP-binding protein n=1 Tax=Paenibacillus alginolyticus TaxID=59839 RepID=UPI000A076594|nr:sensor histidine kinase [Paenibacillus alginolyticus]